MAEIVEIKPHKTENEDGSIWYDYTGFEKETKAQAQAREDLTQLFLEFLTEKFGKYSAVGLIDKNTIAFGCGDVTDNEGYPVFMVGSVKIQMKNYNAHVGPNRTTKAFDLDQAIQNFANGEEE